MEQLRQLLMGPNMKSGLYLIETDLTDGDIEIISKGIEGLNYLKEPLIPSRIGSPFELFITGLSHKCESEEIIELRRFLMTADSQHKENILYSILISMIGYFSSVGWSIIHMNGECDLTDLNHEDLIKLNEAVLHHDNMVSIVCKSKKGMNPICDSVINYVSFKSVNDFNRMPEIEDKFVPTREYTPANRRTIIQNAEKTIDHNIANVTMKELYNEEEFYKDNGWPSEEYSLCQYELPVLSKDAKESDYDQFALIVNALYPYIRLTKRRGNRHIPCGGAVAPSTDGWFATMSEQERDNWCPKIAWGFAAVFLANLRYDSSQKDYVPLKDIRVLIQNYYDKYLKMYLQCHNGLQYKSLSSEQKELDFLNEHCVLEESLWEKSKPLNAYPELSEYARDAKADYEGFLKSRKDTIINKIEGAPIKTKEMREHRIINQNGSKTVYVENNQGTIIIETDRTDRADMSKSRKYSTEIREVFGKQYIKIFFQDDSIVTEAKEIVERLNVVKSVNITPSGSKDHSGNTLTVYPKSMVEVDACENEVREALNGFFAHGIIAEKKPVRNDAYFNGIADEIIKNLDKAKVSIHVCMAWFTNQSIADKLVEKYKQGVDVKVIYYNDHTNSKFGVNIDNIPYKAVRGSRGGVMHNKYCVIDNQTVITGSYNWSDNAENKNDENAVALYDYETASNYTVEFKAMFGSN